MFFDFYKFLEKTVYLNSAKGFQEFYKLDIRKVNKYLSKSDPKMLEKRGREMAFSLFKKASKEVRGYQKWLKENGVKINDIKDIKDFNKIPLTSKDNYLSKYSISDYVWGQDPTKIDLVSASSGSSGEPFYWARGLGLEFETTLVHELFLKYTFEIEKKKTLFIVGYAMGIYVAGVFTQNSLIRLVEKGYPLTITSPGTDKDAILKIIQKIGLDYEQIIISAYPPFLKDLIDKGIAEKTNWKDYNVKFITGGEGLSEEYRAYVFKKLGSNNYLKSSMNTYGSADAAILGHETPLSILIRNLANKNPALQKSLFGESRTPSLQQYYPFFKYFEEINGDLVFSTFGGIPLVRYSIGDNGGVISFDQMMDKLSQNNIDIKSELKKYDSEDVMWKLPFVYLFGRKDNTKIFYGANIYPEHIKNCLEKEEIIDSVTGKYYMDVFFNRNKNQILYLGIELGFKIKPNPKLKRTITSIIHNNLLEINAEYKNSSKTMHLLLPKVELFELGDKKYFKDSIKPTYVKKT